MVEGPPLVGQQRKFVVRPIVGEIGVASERSERGFHRLDVVAHSSDRWVELRTVATLDVCPDLASQPEPKPSPGIVGELPSQRCRNHWTHPERNGDTSGVGERRCGRGGCSDAQPRGLTRFGEDHPRESRCFDLTGKGCGVSPTA